MGVADADRSNTTVWRRLTLRRHTVSDSTTAYRDASAVLPPPAGLSMAGS